jgi:NTP pyrophosphatase (non-canonical NTP hydrolase)
MTIPDIQAKLRTFAKERDWEQFHSPKNLSMALSVEVSELMEHFQWMSCEESLSENLGDSTSVGVTDELADIFLYTLRLADQLNVDLSAAAIQKIAKNAEKYPISDSKGNATKYNRR